MVSESTGYEMIGAEMLGWPQNFGFLVLSFHWLGWGRCNQGNGPTQKIYREILYINAAKTKNFSKGVGSFWNFDSHLFEFQSSEMTHTSYGCDGVVQLHHSLL